MENQIRGQFQKYFGKDCLVAEAPGRINLIGEHTDYNQGFVLPAAIDKNVQVAMALNDEQMLNLYAIEFGERLSFPMNELKPVKGWPTYLLGMIYMMMPEKRLTSGMDVLVTGNIPVGAGMSSSAALCSAFGVALNQIFDLGFSKMDIVLAGQKTEHQFAGVKTGVMDQFASMYGKSGNLMKLDCRSLEHEYIPFDFPDICIVLVNSMVSHSLASSEYNVRRQQCETGVAILQKHYPAIHSLRDVLKSQLEQHMDELGDVVFRRCKFIIEENERLLDGCGLLRQRDIDGFGAIMYRAHEGLSKDYEVSCPESDFIVNTIKHFTGVKGARQMGGGFGGCIITLAENTSSEDIIRNIQEKYKMQYGKIPDCYTMKISEGAHLSL